MDLSLVTYLDAQSTQAVRNIQTELSHITGSRACLDSWLPHNTVGDGLTVNSKEIEKLTDTLKPLLANFSSFKLRLNNYDYFQSRPIGKRESSTPYAIFITVEPNEQLLELVEIIRRSTEHLEKWYRMSTPYSPHITVAFQDLTEEGLRLGMQHLENKTIHLTSTISAVSLVEKTADQNIQRAEINLAN